MLLEYISMNFITLLILLLIMTLILINNKSKLPATDYYFIAVTLCFAVTVAELFNYDSVYEAAQRSDSLAQFTILRKWADVFVYICRPVIILLEVFCIVPNKKKQFICTIPALINGAIYSTALFESKLAFYFNENYEWDKGPLSLSVYVTQFIYIVMLLGFSLRFFKSNKKNTLLILNILINATAVSLLEYHNTGTSYTNTVTAFCMLIYYIYLMTAFQREINELLAEKQIEAYNSEISLLRSQIQPHFIYNTLSIIRSLVRTDSSRAADTITTFSKYLRTHINAIQDKDMISFEDELENVRVYIDLAQADYPGKIEMVYDFQTVNFRIPMLSLEPIVENAIQHGISKNGGIITISTREDDSEYTICVFDNGTAKKDLTQKAIDRLGVGIENTRKRLTLQCSGKLFTEETNNGYKVTVVIPKRNGEKE